LKVSKVEAIQTEEAIQATLELMRKGIELIYQGCVQFEHEGVVYRGRPDLLEKREGKSVFGNWYYAPIEIKWSSKIKPTYKNQLSLYSIILEKFQGYLPKEVGMINRHHARLSLVLDEEDIAKTRTLIEQIIEVLHGSKPDLTITSKSKDSPWFKVALAEAEEKQDIALIYRLDSRSLGLLEKRGFGHYRI
jgi:predicted RecB family nuclease